MKRKRIWIFGISGLVLLLLVFCSLEWSSVVHGSTKTTEPESQDKYPVIAPVVMDTSYTADYVAQIQAANFVSLKAHVSGYLDKIHVDEGQHVKKGQLLFSLNSSEYQVNLLKAEAVLKSAIADTEAEKVEFNNVKELVGKNVVSGTELEKEKARLDALMAKVDECNSECANARLNLTYARITAPFDGIIGQIPNKAGSLIEEGTLLTTIADNSSIFAYFSVSEQEYLDFTDLHDNLFGRKVSLILANQDKYPYVGTIESIDNNIDKGTGNLAFRATFNNPELLLKQGGSGKIRITKEIRNALIIPQTATFDVQDKTFVFTVGNDNIARQRAVVPAVRLSNIYVIESGLTASDRIVYEGIQKIKDGDRIDFTMVPYLLQNKDSYIVAGR